jgi:nucleotidyltransferase/DNA polymerase involved in DNA repair
MDKKRLTRGCNCFLEELPIRKFYGVGKVTTEKMYQLGIFTGVELKVNR